MDTELISDLQSIMANDNMGIIWYLRTYTGLLAYLR